MFDFGCHRIEVLLHIFGEITQVTAQTAKTVFDREVEDTAAALFKFASGACGTLTVSHAAREPQDTLEVFGSLGTIHVPVLNAGQMQVIAASAERTEALPPAENVHQPLIENFVHAVLNGREPAVSGVVGRSVARIEEEIYGKSRVNR